MARAPLPHHVPLMKLSQLLRGAHVEVWEAFAREIGGTWNSPGFSDTPLIEVPHSSGPLRIEGEVTMLMAGKVVMPVVTTRFLALRPPAAGLRFSVSRASFASSVAEWFGSLDIQVDDPAFDEAFVLKGDAPDMVRALFASASLRERYLRDFEGQIHRRDDRTIFGDPTPDADPFELLVPGYIDNPERLRALWRLFVETLERMPDTPKPRGQ